MIVNITSFGLISLLESLTRQGEELTGYIEHTKVSSFLQCLQRLDAITKTY